MVKKFVKPLMWIWKVFQPVGFVLSFLGLFGWVPIMLGLLGAILAFMQTLNPLIIFFSLIGGYAVGITAVNQRDAWKQRRNRNQEQTNRVQRRKPERIEHDGVLWEHTGKYYAFSNALLAEGPLCPKDYCPLSLRYGGRKGGREEVRADNQDDKIISKSYYHAILFCLQCKKQYTLVAKEEGKKLAQSRHEVESLFEGLHRRAVSNEKEMDMGNGKEKGSSDKAGNTSC